MKTQGLVVTVGLGAAVLASGLGAQRLRLPQPVLAIAIGTALGLIPLFDGLSLPPAILLTVFVPALLYWDSLNTSLREIRRNWLTISSLSVVLVIGTAALVAVLGHALGLSWEMAILLGAVLSPTDATAIEGVLRRLPRRFRTILRTESLINDGTALVLYGVAVSSAVGMTPYSIPAIGGAFVVSYVAATAIGLAVGALAAAARLLIRRDIFLNSTISVVTPFVAFLIAEELNVSGVLAVVAAGLLLSQVGPHLITASMRAQSFGFWQLATYLLSTALFVLIGFQVTDLLNSGVSSLGAGLTLGLACAGGVTIARLVWMSVTPFQVPRRRKAARERVRVRERLPLGWAGFRGAVSLAAALSIPTVDSAGVPLEGRDQVITATVVVILFTLCVQGITMPAVVRFARFPTDDSEKVEQRLAERASAQAALDGLDGAAAQLGTSAEVVASVRNQLTEKLRRSTGQTHPSASGENVEQRHDLERSLLPVERAALFRLRREMQIDDVVLRRAQSRLDREELRLNREDGA